MRPRLPLVLQIVLVKAGTVGVHGGALDFMTTAAYGAVASHPTARRLLLEEMEGSSVKSSTKCIYHRADTTFSVYDLMADRRTVKIDAHENDVNSCCWADTASGNVLISASDDTFLKVW